MKDDTPLSAVDAGGKNKNIDTNITLQQLEADHGEKGKSAKDLADEAFQPDSDPVELPEHPGKSKKGIKAWFHDLTKKQKIILALVVLLIISGATAGAWFVFHKKPAPRAQPLPIAEQAPPQPTTVPSKLSGLQVDPSVNERPVTGVMIENSPDARPQSGLRDASVVFEAVAEGGVTRFLALFQDTVPKYVGPVRSARPYYLQWLKGFDAGYAHVGGSPDAFKDIKAWHVKDLDEFYNPGFYTRITSRYAPHNVYTGIDRLMTLEKQKGYTRSDYTGFARNETAADPGKTPTKTIDLSLSGYFYNPHWDYDAKSKLYRRSEGGKPHVDQKSGKQITATVLVAMVMKKGTMSDGYHSTYGAIGSGRVYVFQGGNVIVGTWKKTDLAKQIVFSTPDGKELKLDPGKTWLTAVGDKGDVTYK